MPCGHLTRAFLELAGPCGPASTFHMSRPGWARTSDNLFIRRVLYQLSYGSKRDRSGVRTHVRAVRPTGFADPRLIQLGHPVVKPAQNLSCRGLVEETCRQHCVCFRAPPNATCGHPWPERCRLTIVETASPTCAGVRRTQPLSRSGTRRDGDQPSLDWQRSTNKRP